MFKNSYLRSASKRYKNNNLNFQDFYYRELFRFQKDMGKPEVSSGEYEYILYCYDKTIENHKDYFCLYNTDKIPSSYEWLLYCLKVLNIHFLTFQDPVDRINFISNLKQEVGDGYMPISFIEGVMEVENGCSKTFYDVLFGVVSNQSGMPILNRE